MIQKSYQILPYHMLIILTSKNLHLFTIGLDILKKITNKQWPSQAKVMEKNT